MPKKGKQKVEKNVNLNMLKTTACSVSEAYDRFRHDNPLLVRKKLQMKDVWFRRDQPDVELFRTELAFDVELYVILIAVLVGTVYLFYKIVRCMEQHRVRRLEKKCCRTRQK